MLTLGPATQPDAFNYTTGLGTHLDLDTVVGTVGLVSGRVQWSYFTASKTATVSNARTFTTSAGAAGATPTLCRVGLYAVNASTTDLTLVASTTNDTAMWAANGSTYSKTLSASVTLTAGVRYAVGVLVVTAATAPSLWGSSSLNTAPNQHAVAPRRQAQLSSQTDLPSSATEAGMANGSGRPYVYFY